MLFSPIITPPLLHILDSNLLVFEWGRYQTCCPGLIYRLVTVGSSPLFPDSLLDDMCKPGVPRRLNPSCWLPLPSSLPTTSHFPSTTLLPLTSIITELVLPCTPSHPRMLPASPTPLPQLPLTFASPCKTRHCQSFVATWMRDKLRG